MSAGTVHLRGVRAAFKGTAETRSCHCKWPLTSSRPHLPSAFEVCRRGPASFLANSPHWRAAAVECREPESLARVRCREPKPGPGGFPGAERVPKGDGQRHPLREARDWSAGQIVKCKSACEGARESLAGGYSSGFPAMALEWPFAGKGVIGVYGGKRVSVASGGAESPCSLSGLLRQGQSERCPLLVR